MKWYKVVISILVIYLISLFSFSGCNGRPEIIEIEKIDTIQIYDTAYIQQPPEIIKIYEQVPKYITEVRVDTVKENTILVTENKTYKDSICTKDNDSIFVTNTIQGVNANLLSTEVELRKTDKVITNTITITKHIKDKKHWNIGPSISTGYDPFNKQWVYCLGVSVLY